MQRVMTNLAGNPGRGSNRAAVGTAHLVYTVREQIAEFFNSGNPQRVIFTNNTTHSINQALFGLLQTGDHVITTSIEHNAVVRPLKALTELGVSVTEISVVPGEEFPFVKLKAAFQKSTKLVVTLHASNVSGNLLPIHKIGKLAREIGVLYLVDAAQTVGIYPIDVKKISIDLLAFPGHKGLLGPQGTGGLIIGPNITLRPLIYGGTGSLSESDRQPDFLPDALESGTLNVVGIAGLGMGLKYIHEYGIDHIRIREQEKCQQLIDGLLTVPEVKIHGGTTASEKVPIVAFNIGDYDSMMISYLLDKEFGVISRAGLHCAPRAHTVLETIDQGLVRFSPSHFTTELEIEQAIEAVRKVAKELVER